MASRISSMDFGKRLCAILGLNPSKIHTITITISRDDLVRVKVDGYLMEEEAEKTLLLAKEFDVYEEDTEHKKSNSHTDK